MQVAKIICIHDMADRIVNEIVILLHNLYDIMLIKVSIIHIKVIFKQKYLLLLCH